MKLYLNFERALSPAEVDRFRELIVRRGRREPLQHIVGSTSFCGLELAVSHQALVPRPETEILAELGWQFLNQFPSPQSRPPTALDFGTGGGCLAIALAVKCPAAHVWAMDISPEALNLAKQNAARHLAPERIQFLQSDGFAALPLELRFDLIVSNPPYIPSAEIGTLQPEVRDYDPRCALDGGPDGLDCFRRLAAEGQHFVEPDGRIMVELGDGQADRVSGIFEHQKWVAEGVRTDYSQRPRVLVARRAG
jgi:release factor glutamine methyltransferase